MMQSELIQEEQSCLRNVVALFHVVEKEMAWRKSISKPEGFETMRTFRPIVAVGADHPLDDEALMADHFRKMLPFQRHVSESQANMYITRAPLQMALMVYTGSMMSTHIFRRPTLGKASSTRMRLFLRTEILTRNLTRRTSSRRNCQPTRR
jgi:hypothetical protein